jgi:aspartate/methionine/tyrosine aminotransferase
MMANLPEGAFADDIDASMKLIKELGVATIPPSVFYGKSDEGKMMLRICFAKRDETLLEGVKRLKSFGKMK